ncbi:MAG: hypothetical protein O3B24_09695 [Verrucomicrobia bacterium]|nr:hypothetical protein [Verrucomicrobiota bacterium]
MTAASVAVALALLPGAGEQAQAGKILLRIQAGNPVEADKEQSVTIKTNLPEGVRTNHILSLGGLELGYDVKSDQYYVHRELTLAPRQIRIFDVEIDDIWVIPDAELAALRTHAARMQALLTDYPQQRETADEYTSMIEENLARIEEFQRANKIGPGVQPLTHIRAHASNLETLKRVKIDVGRVENLVLGTGQDPGGMLGDDRRSPKPERFLDSAVAYTNTAVLRIEVENTSPDRARKIPVRYNLPEEIREHDVVDAGGLELATDKERGIAYVFKQGLELGPREKRVFNIRIKDKWNINAPRITALDKTAGELLVRVEAAGKFASLEEALRAIINDLEAVAAERGPTTVDAQYVAFYRGQATRLDEIEARVNRIVMAIPQIDRSTKIGPRIKPPSAKTTWLIIYIILGFLALLSVTFYFRWYGKHR